MSVVAVRTWGSRDENGELEEAEQHEGLPAYEHVDVSVPLSVKSVERRAGSK